MRNELEGIYRGKRGAVIVTERRKKNYWITVAYDERFVCSERDVHPPKLHSFEDLLLTGYSWKYEEKVHLEGSGKSRQKIFREYIWQPPSKF